MPSPPSSPNFTHSKRISLTQLPLPSAVNQPKAPSPPASTSPAGPSITKPPTPTLAAAPPRASPNSPTRSNFVSPSSTHASGILPSASFFRPSRPNHQPQYYRPHSIDSQDVISRDGDDVFQMAALSKQASRGSSDDHAHRPPVSPIGEPASATSLGNPGKKVHDALLPTVLGRTSLSARPSISREVSTTSNISSKAGPKAIVRTSLDRVFNLSRGMDVESFHGTQPNRGVDDTASIDDITSLDHKFDHETSMFDSRRVSYAATGRKDSSSSPGHFGHPMDVSRGGITPSPSPDTSFVPTPPPPAENLAFVPFKHPDTGASVRNYQRHPSSNHFFLQGRLLTGGDSPWAFIGAFSIVLAISGVWFGTTAIWWWNNESPAVAAVVAYFTLLTIVTMLTTAFSDPGILPRNLDPDPPYPPSTSSDYGSRGPMPRDLKVRADVVRVKYCHTCKTYRPPRSSHCRMCDNCVDNCDHHCQWVNNCIGHRNYTTFCALLLTATIALLLVIVTSALHIYFVSAREDVGFGTALGRAAGSAVVFCLSVVVIWPVGALLSYHMRLLLLNITTIEQIRNQAHKTLVPGEPPHNPFSHGTWFRNLVAVLCRPVGYSWLDFHALSTEDKRTVNPGLVDT